MKPLVLGLTGSIGMGKSTTAAMFAEAGIPVWDADAAVHALYAPGGAGTRAIGDLVPDAVTPQGVDRTVLRDHISRDPTLLSRVEAVVHPLVAADREAFLARHATRDIVLLDIPLLFEAGGAEAVDRIVVVTTDADEQRRRVLSRGNMDEATFERLLSRQLPDAQKRARADHVIRTDGLAQTRKSVESLIEQLRGELGTHA